MSLFHAGLQPALDSNGNPINGATWNFYLTGTTTPAAVYSNNGLSVSLGATVTANSAGRFSTIFLNDAVTYRAILKDAGGAEIKDIDPANTTAAANTNIYVDPQTYGALGDGVTDDASALQLALDTGRPVYLDPSYTYAFGSQLLPPTGGGFVGGGKLYMLTGTGQFDMVDYTEGPFTYSGIYADSKGDIRIEARIEMQANAAIRTCNAIWIRNCTDVHLDVECFNFKEARYGIVEWNSNIGGSVKAYVHDCTTNTTTLPSMQITGVSVDSNRYDPGSGAIQSEGCRFDCKFKDITLGAAARTAYGPQTDGLNFQGSGYAGHSGRIVADTVDEPFDCWSDGNEINIVARNCYWGAKLLYGASHNIVRVAVDTYEQSGVVFAGATAALKATAYNHVVVTASGGGEIGTQSDVSGVRFEDPTGSFDADFNTIELNYKGNGVALDYGAQIKGGSNNTVIVEGSGAATSVGIIAGTGTYNVIKRKRPTLVRAHLAANATIADLAYFVLDTETIDRHSEYDPTTGIFTAKSTATLRVKFKTQALPGTGAAYGSYIQKSGADVSRKRDINTGGASAVMQHEHAAIVQVVPGDTIRIRNDSSAATDYYGGTTVTYLEIEEI